MTSVSVLECSELFMIGIGLKQGVFYSVIISLFWASFVVVGYSVLTNLEKRYRNKEFSDDPLLRLFLAIALGFITLIPLVLVGYVLAVPIFVVSWTWIVLTLVALVDLIKNKEFQKYFKLITSNRILWWIIGVLALDYGLSLVVGGYVALGGDAWMHMARINDLVFNGMSIREPFFPELVDGRYNYTLIHPAYAAGTDLLRVPTIEFWMLSFGFFRFIYFLGAYLIAKMLTKDKFLTVVITVTAIITLSFNTRFVLYPNRLVIAWFVLFVFVMTRYLAKPKDKINIILLVSTAALIAMTHVGFSASVGAFVLLATAIYALWTRSKNVFSKYIWTLPVAGILVLPAVYGLTLPYRFARSFGAKFEFIEVFGFEILNPVSDYTLAGLVSLIVITIYAFRKKVSKPTKSVLLAGLFLYPLIAYTPVISEAANELIVTALIKRFKGTNFAGLFSINMSILIAVYWFSTARKKLKSKAKQLTVLTAILILVFNFHSYSRIVTEQYGRNNFGEKVYGHVIKTTDGKSSEDKVIIVANNDISYLLPVAGNFEVLNIERGHAPTSADQAVRESCKAELLSDDVEVRHIALHTLKPAYYFEDSNADKNVSVFEELELTMSYKDKIYDYKLYSIDYSVISVTDDASPACSAIIDGEA